MQKFYAKAQARIHSYASQDNAVDNRKNLTAELFQARKLVRSIQDTYNSLSPALSLPSELWSEIAWIVFQSCQETWLPGKYGLLKGFLPLTHICHRLRTLLRSTSGFWTLLDLRSPTARSMVTLSGNQPLTVNCNAEHFKEMRPQWIEDQFEEELDVGRDDGSDMPGPRADALIAAATAKKRIERLLVVSDYDGMSTCLRQLNEETLPNLRSLKLKVEGWDEDYDYRADPVIRLSSTSLHTLRLHGVDLYQNVSSFASLKHLTLSSYADIPRLFVTLPRLMGVLEHCKILEELCLLNAILPPGADEPAHPPINLTSLRSLTIAHYREMIYTLLQLITYPALQDLHLRVQTDSDILEDVTPWPVISAYNFIRQQVEQTKAVMISCAKSQITIGTPRGPWVPQTYNLNHRPEFGAKVELQLSSNPSALIPLSLVLGHLFSETTTQFCEVLILDLGGQVKDDVDIVSAWPALFASVPNLQALHLSTMDVVEPMLEELMPEVGGHVPCPKLENMTLCGYEIPDAPASDPHWPEVKKLRDVVVSRHHRNVPLTSLRMRTSVPYDHYAVKEVLEEVRRVVQNVYVAHTRIPCDCVYLDDLEETSGSDSDCSLD